MPRKQSFGVPTLRVPVGVKDPEVRAALLEMARQNQAALRLMTQRLDEQRGNRGTPRFETDIDLGGHRIKSVGAPVESDDAQIAGLSLPLVEDYYDAQNRLIKNVAEAETDFEAVRLAQLKAEVEALKKLINSTTTPATFDVVTSTVTGTGFAVDPTGTATYLLVGTRLVILMLPELTGTSDATTFTVTGLPGAIQPTETWFTPAGVEDDSVSAIGLVRFNSGSTTLDVFPAADITTPWTNTGTKTLRAFTVSYTLTA
jgi:hypothetical protein